MIRTHVSWCVRGRYRIRRLFRFIGGQSGAALAFPMKVTNTTTPDTTRPSRLPVDRRRRDAGQAGSYA